MSYNHDARNAWAQTIKKKSSLRGQNKGDFIRQNSSLHAYPAVRFCEVRIQTGSSVDMGNVEISRTVPRVEVPHCDFSVENSVMERIKQMEEQDDIDAEKRVKFNNAKKLLAEQTEQLKNLSIERKRREEEQKKIEEQEAEEKEQASKLREYANITGEWDGDKIKDALKKHAWDLQKAISEWVSKSDHASQPEGEGQGPGRPVASQSDTVKINIYIDNEKHTWNYKSSDTLWDLYTMVARSGKNEAFHFVDSNGKKYKEHMFDTTFANAGWVPEVTLTVCKDEHKLSGFQ